MIFNTIDDYIAQFPAETREILNKLRSTIAENAPEATEKISYNMPTFYLNGNLVHFAGYKNYIGFYGIPSSTDKFSTDLIPYLAGKDAIQLPIDQPLPFDLIGELVRYRVIENNPQFA